MRAICVVLLVLTCAALNAAPTPFLKSKPKAPPKVVSPHWVVDFSPMSPAGPVMVSLVIKVRTAAGESNLSVSQGGQVNVNAIINAVSNAYFDKTDLINDLTKGRMTIKSHKGRPVTNVEVTMTGLAPNFAPAVTPPG